MYDTRLQPVVAVGSSGNKVGHGRNCTHAQCVAKRKTSRHAVVECKRYAAARMQFTLETGLEITVANYIDIMSLNPPD